MDPRYPPSNRTDEQRAVKRAYAKRRRERKRQAKAMLRAQFGDLVGPNPYDIRKAEIRKQAAELRKRLNANYGKL